MFDPLLDLRRRRMMGVPQVTGNIQPPVVGPDIAPASIAPPPMMEMFAPAQTAGPDFSPLVKLGVSRAQDFMLRRQRGQDAKAGQAVLSRMPGMSKLFRR